MNNPIQVCFVLIEHDGKIGLIQEGGPLAYGTWCLPGGHVDEGEELEAAAVREAREEIGLAVTISEKLLTLRMDGEAYRGNEDDFGKEVELHIFRGLPLGTDIQKGEEELDAGWYSKEEVRALPLRFDFISSLF